MLIAEAQLAFKTRYDEAYAEELVKAGLPRFGARSDRRQRAAMRALNRIMDDDLTGQIAGCA